MPAFSYAGGFALHNINLFVPSGQMAGLLGPNGSGKTTLLKLATGVLPLAEGDILVGGVSLRKTFPKRGSPENCGSSPAVRYSICLYS